MTRTVELPLWLLILILLFAAVTFASHFLFPSVRWFLRRRAERIVAKLNTRLARPIAPFKLARRTDMIQRLIYDPAVAEAVTEHARETGVREDVAFEQARRYAREIVPGFSATAYFGFATRAAKWLSTHMFDVRLHQPGGADLRDIDPDATVVYVINHRSNMDYVLVTYLVAPQSALAYAVGEWARIWPLGPLIRALGGYFIRRRSRTALYRKVLARYVQLATAGGVIQAIFPEGGLSQTGALGAPKVGLLSYLLDGTDLETHDLVFVPVALNYDRVIEDNILIEAQAKGERRFRGTIPSATAFSLRYMWRRITGRAQKFGAAGVSFGAPLTLSAWEGPNEATAIAEELMARIKRALPVLPVPLLASILHDADPPVSRPEVLERFQARIADLEKRGAVLLLEDGGPEVTLDNALHALAVRRILTSDKRGLSVIPGKEPLIRYYAASVPPRSETRTKAPRPPVTSAT
ncbi:MAG: 1-acyl-sn-glycerol-3-phosphate acyltransferase [Pseudomonadota bacterium]